MAKNTITTIQAQEFVKKGDKKVNSFSFGKLLGDPSTKYEEAMEFYVKGANCYKVAKQMELAAGAFIKAAECCLKSDNASFEAATHYVSAGGCLRKVNPADAINCLQIAVDCFCKEGKFGTAAKQQKEIAELFESQLDSEHALQAYQQAADYFEGESQSSQGNACLLKVAHFAAQLEDYNKAIQLYEKIAQENVDNNLLKWGVKDHLLKAGLCRLASGDLVDTARAIENYQEWDVSFSTQKECKFLKDVLATCGDWDTEAFTKIVADFDATTKLDSWKTSVLLKIKHAYQDEGKGLA